MVQYVLHIVLRSLQYTNVINHKYEQGLYLKSCKIQSLCGEFYSLVFVVVR
jgi:hypothetical protein